MTMDGGRFVGGAGADSVDTRNGGRFHGNTGNDSVSDQNNGFFLGGPGTDRVNRRDGGTGTTSELEVTTNSACSWDPAPAPAQELVSYRGGLFSWSCHRIQYQRAIQQVEDLLTIELTSGRRARP